jgi:hypothetical protein
LHSASLHGIFKDQLDEEESASSTVLTPENLSTEELNERLQRMARLFFRADVMGVCSRHDVIGL